MHLHQRLLRLHSILRFCQAGDRLLVLMLVLVLVLMLVRKVLVMVLL